MSKKCFSSFNWSGVWYCIVLKVFTARVVTVILDVLRAYYDFKSVARLESIPCFESIGLGNTKQFCRVVCVCVFFLLEILNVLALPLYMPDSAYCCECILLHPHVSVYAPCLLPIYRWWLFVAGVS